MNQAVIIVHVVAGTVALASGAAALIAAKGRDAHIRAGTVFFGSMVVMTSAGTLLAIQRHSAISIQGGTLAFYLVLTSWLAARRRNGVAGSIERGAFLFALACVL